MLGFILMRNLKVASPEITPGDRLSLEAAGFALEGQIEA